MERLPATALSSCRRPSAFRDPDRESVTALFSGNGCGKEVRGARARKERWEHPAGNTDESTVGRGTKWGAV